MKASMKKELQALAKLLNVQVAQARDLLVSEEDYAADLENDDKIEESEGRQEMLGELAEILDTAESLIADLLA